MTLVQTPRSRQAFIPTGSLFAGVTGGSEELQRSGDSSFLSYNAVYNVSSALHLCPER